MSNRRESFRVTALTLLLTVVAVGGASWTDEAAAQELVLSRPPVVTEAAVLPGGTDFLIAVGSLQIVGVLVFETMAFVRRRRGSVDPKGRLTPPLFWRVPARAAASSVVEPAPHREAA